MWPHDSRPNDDFCGAQRAMQGPYCGKHRAMATRNPETEPRERFVPRHMLRKTAA